MIIYLTLYPLLLVFAIGKMIKYKLKCTYDFQQKYEGMIFYSGTKYLDDKGKEIDLKFIYGIQENATTYRMVRDSIFFMPSYKGNQGND
jgi:hypothetical protein